MLIAVFNGYGPVPATAGQSESGRDELFAQVGRVVPEFGGAYFEGETLQI
ncbi:MAG: hypothetical protein ACRDQ7_11580 [Haloechinothrix sp.]